MRAQNTKSSSQDLDTKQFLTSYKFNVTGTIPSIHCVTTVFLSFSCPWLLSSELFNTACCSTLTTGYEVLTHILLIPNYIQIPWVWEPSKMCLGKNIIMTLVARLIQTAGRIKIWWYATMTEKDLRAFEGSQCFHWLGQVSNESWTSAIVWSETWKLQNKFSLLYIK